MVRTLWSVLVEVMAPREASNAREYPQRQEKPVQMEGFVSARDMQIFSGSSEEEDSAGILQKPSQESFELRSLDGSEVDEE
jgi:hypothetical protein